MWKKRVLAENDAAPSVQYRLMHVFEKEVTVEFLLVHVPLGEG